MIPQDVKANAAVGIDVGVIDTSSKVHLRGLERVVGGECNAQEEYARRVWTVGLEVKSASDVCRKPDYS